MEQNAIYMFRKLQVIIHPGHTDAVEYSDFPRICILCRRLLSVFPSTRGIYIINWSGLHEFWDSIHYAVRRLTTKPREVSEAARLDVSIIVSLSNLGSAAAEVPLKFQRAIRKV